MMRQWLPGLILCSSALAAGCGVSASATGVTADFADAARKAHGYLTSDVIPAIGTARFPLAIAASRARVKVVQSKVAGEADQGVWLLLTMVNVKSDELNASREMAETMNLSSQAMRTLRESALEVATERDTCLFEANSWLNGAATPLHLRVMNEAPCLRQAKLALAMLTKNKK
jgi:hypothetical protein